MKSKLVLVEQILGRKVFLEQSQEGEKTNTLYSGEVTIGKPTILKVVRPSSNGEQIIERFFTGSLSLA